jgi:hypothetical protein
VIEREPSEKVKRHCLCLSPDFGKLICLGDINDTRYTLAECSASVQADSFCGYRFFRSATGNCFCIRVGLVCVFAASETDFKIYDIPDYSVEVASIAGTNIYDLASS